MQGEPPHTLKVVTVWLLLGGLVFLGIQWWLREQQQAHWSSREGVVEIRRGSDGHYHWPGTINGRTVDFLVDTGATGTAIPSGLARELSLAVDGEMMSSTAGGMVRGQQARADVTLEGGVRIARLPVAVLPALEAPLLGMNVLGRLHWTQRDGVLSVDTTLTR